MKNRQLAQPVCPSVLGVIGQGPRMRFALLGDHPDGLDFARAVLASGRHELAGYAGPAVGADYLRRWGAHPRAVGDPEELLADPDVEAVIVAGGPSVRAAQLRRVLQSERHALCVHPADESPDSAYEAALLQHDTGRVLFPLLPEATHPALDRLAELLGKPAAEGGSPLGPLKLLQLERWSAEAVLLDASPEGHKPGLPGWEVLRAIGGDVVEVFAFAATEEVAAEQPLLLAGRFASEALFQVSLVPEQPEPRWQLAAVGAYGRAELTFPEGWPGPARLVWGVRDGEVREETWPAWNPWLPLLGAFERAVEAGGDGGVAWQQEVRCLELDDAARRSVERRRANTLDLQEINEEVGFKGTMTLVGCSLIWGSLVLLILSWWQPWLGWLIAPLFGVFLVMQLLRWLVPPTDQPPAASEEKGQGAS
jgi:predicted dehydrogenase